MHRIDARVLKRWGWVTAWCLSAPAAFAQASGVGDPAWDRGRDLFGRHCARCHGSDAAGTADAPNLLARLQGMSESNFTSAVLQRYAWSVPASEGSSESALRDATRCCVAC